MVAKIGEFRVIVSKNRGLRRNQFSFCSIARSFTLLYHESSQCSSVF